MLVRNKHSQSICLSVIRMDMQCILGCARKDFNVGLAIWSQFKVCLCVFKIPCNLFKHWERRGGQWDKSESHFEWNTKSHLLKCYKKMHSPSKGWQNIDFNNLKWEQQFLRWWSCVKTNKRDPWKLRSNNCMLSKPTDFALGFEWCIHSPQWHRQKIYSRSVKWVRAVEIIYGNSLCTGFSSSKKNKKKNCYVYKYGTWCVIIPYWLHSLYCLFSHHYSPAHETITHD